MAGPKDVLLARHGETDDNAAARFQGRLDPPLNERGREQARDLAARLEGEGVRTLIASPLLRAHQTAEIVAEVLGLEIVLEPRLMEADVGDWAGQLHADVQAADPDGYAAWRAADITFRCPGGESVAEQAERVAAAIADVRRDHELPAVLVCHGGTIRSALGLHRGGDTIANGSVHVAPADAGATGGPPLPEGSGV